MEDIFVQSVLTLEMEVEMHELNSNQEEFKQKLRQMARQQFEGKCVPGGFMQKGSTEIISFSAGLMQKSVIHYKVLLSCNLFHPVKEMLLRCKATNITQAGIKAISADDPENTPFIVFVPRMETNGDSLSDIVENDLIVACVIDFRITLNAAYVSVIAKFVRFIK